MVMAGVVLTVMVIVARLVLPPWSVADAVSTWVPVESALVVIVPPVPSVPSRLEVQAMPAVRRSEERRVGKEWRGRGAPGQQEKTAGGEGSGSAGVVCATGGIAAGARGRLR